MRNSFVIIVFILFCASCERFARQTYAIRIENKSLQVISVYGEYMLSDTLLPKLKPSLTEILPNESGFLYGYEVNDDSFERLKNEKITVFVFSKDTIDKYEWNLIREDYKILHRYEFNSQELVNMGGSVNYP